MSANPAYAEPSDTSNNSDSVEGLEYVGGTPLDGAVDISPAPGDSAWKFVVHFSKNVSWANQGRDDSFIQRNFNRVSLQTADGQVVYGSWVTGASSQAERTVIYIRLEEWLEPLTQYQIVMEPGIEAANGRDVTTERYVVSFTTGAMTESGFTVFQYVVAACVVAVLAVGIAVQVRRTIKRK